MRKILVTTAIASLLASLTATAPATGAELAGVSMSDTTKVAGKTLVLNGVGLRKKAIFKVYVGGLYLPRKSANPDQILRGDEPRQLALQFVRSVDADSIAGAWDECLEANNSNADASVRRDFAKLGTWMADVDDGDRLVFTYDPAKGTEVMVKGDVAGTLAGKPFADALFRCWIGPHPPSDDFKSGLLGG